MEKCKYGFGTDECLKIMKRDKCLDKCQHIRESTHDEILGLIAEFLLDDSRVMRAENDEEEREKVIRENMDVTDRIVEAVLKNMGNSRLSMEIEDIKAEMHIVIDVSIKDFDMTKASFKTFVSWGVRGQLSNLLRKYRADKRSVNYHHISGSLQDTVEGDNEEEVYEKFIGRNDPEFSRVEDEQFIMELSEEEQQVIRLMIDGYDTKEIFNLLGISIVEIYSIISSIEIKSEEFNGE